MKAYLKPRNNYNSLFVKCYAVQAFSIISDFDPKLMPKKESDHE